MTDRVAPRLEEFRIWPPGCPLLFFPLRVRQKLPPPASDPKEVAFCLYPLLSDHSKFFSPATIDASFFSFLCVILFPLGVGCQKNCFTPLKVTGRARRPRLVALTALWSWRFNARCWSFPLAIDKACPRSPLGPFPFYRFFETLFSLASRVWLFHVPSIATCPRTSSVACSSQQFVKLGLDYYLSFLARWSFQPRLRQVGTPRPCAGPCF